MNELPTIITFIATSLVPIASCIISILNYINKRKKKEVDKKVEREITQNNTSGDNYYYEDNRKIEISADFNNLIVEQERLSIKQQNIDDASKFFSRHSFWFVLILYIINVWNLVNPLPDYPPISFDLNGESLLKFFANSLYRATLPTIVSILLLLSLLCIALALKHVIIAKKITNFISAIYYFFTAIIYFLCKETVAKIPLEKINFSSESMQKFELSGFIQFLLPFILIVTLILLWVIAQMLIQILFETEQSKPNLRLFKVVFPRFGFMIALLVFPILIVLASQYI